MDWFRSRSRWGSYLALFALAFQLALTFGHVHLDRFAPISADKFTVASADASMPTHVTRPPIRQAEHDRADHRCPICTLIHLAGALVLAEPPSLPLPDCLRPLADRDGRSRSTSPNPNARSLRRAHLPLPDIDLVPARPRASDGRADTPRGVASP